MIEGEGRDRDRYDKGDIKVIDMIGICTTGRNLAQGPEVKKIDTTTAESQVTVWENVRKRQNI